MGLRAGSKLGIRGRDVKPTQSPAQASLNGAPRSEVDAMRLGRPLKARLRKERDRLANRHGWGIPFCIRHADSIPRQPHNGESSSKRGGYTVNTVAQRSLV